MKIDVYREEARTEMRMIWVREIQMIVKSVGQ